MKKLTLFLFIMAAFIACSKQHEHDGSMKPGHAMISLPTIQCETCVATIEAAVKKVAGVTAISIDLKGKMAHVQYDAAKTDQRKIEMAIADAGYDANDVKRNEAAHAKLPACCQTPR
ncbi:MAG TPA: heavy-metal-associated domain-containing protein [bacterium]|nr:heavy-metal-associated domain-containing protein [bacterium]HPR89739.1 heavy-metal-associated domain-containing protein [bacterium]